MTELTGRLSPEKRRRLNDRLSKSIDRSDSGQLLPGTFHALSMTSRSERLVALVRALGTERLIVPIPGDNCGQGDSGGALQIAESPGGQGIVAFSSGSDLANWDPTARPILMSSQEVALTALAVGVPRIWFNPGSADSLLIPRPAVDALSNSAQWLPAWNDPELLNELQTVAVSTGLNIAVKVGPSLAQSNGWWDAGIQVDVLVGSNPSSDRRAMLDLLEILVACPRLQVASESIHFTPRLWQA